ncbi:MAG TPA: OB-fold domain-containing protein [Bryobacteraceae bacterium]|jgi:uncharacterized OB-fold protein|nr:OB-fold domain-containing protein [Bryobacteraceae bacterium]
MRTGTIYTETVIYSAPEAFTKDVPYQTAIVRLDSGGRITGRIVGDRVAIDDRVTEVPMAELAAAPKTMGVPFFRKA